MVGMPIGGARDISRAVDEGFRGLTRGASGSVGAYGAGEAFVAGAEGGD